MTLLWAARRGLSEAELLDLLGHDGIPLPRARWSPLHLAAEPSLVNRSGLIGFFHDYLRQAVEGRYLPTEKERREAHLRLASYFGRQELGARKIDELPWQLAQAEAWQALYDLLADLPFFDAAYQANEFEVKAYWVQIETKSPLRLMDAYRPVLEDPQAYARAVVSRVSDLVADTGHPEEAFGLRSGLVEHYRATGERAYLAVSLGYQGRSLLARGDLDGAMALWKEVERLFRELRDRYGLAHTLGNQALILKARGDLDGATALWEEVERICRELGDKDGLQACLGGQAGILYARGDLDGAMALMNEEERLCRELGNKAALSRFRGNQALILNARGDQDGAMALLKEVERLCRELGDKYGL